MSFWRDKHVLVTGACGFLGSNLLKAIIDAEAVPVGLDLVSYSPSLLAVYEHGLVPNVMAQDVLSTERLLETIREVKPDVIFHMAGRSHIQDSHDAPGDAFRVNVLGTLSVLEAVRLGKPDMVVVVASSNHAYRGGLSSHQSLKGLVPRLDGGYGCDEDTPLQAVDVYGASKVCADNLVRSYRHSFGLRAVAVRNVNAYGYGDPYTSHLVTGSIVSCLKGERPQLRSDGSAIKGYLFAGDVARAYMMVAEHADHVPGHAVNVADAGSEASALVVARIVMDVAGIAGNPEVLAIDNSQKGYEERLDSGLLKASFGWTPTHTLYSGIRATYEWYKEHKGMAWRDSSG